MNLIKFEIKETPIFKSFAVLAIPAIGMQPSMDEIQQYLNKAVQAIVNTSKSINQWTKGRKLVKKRSMGVMQDVKTSLDVTTTTLNGTSGDDSVVQGGADESQLALMSDRPSSPAENAPRPQKNYYKAVSENKDIAKLISLLFTCLSATKKDVLNALDHFKEYQFIWQKDRDDDLKEFVATDPKVGEYEARIREFEQLIDVVNAYPEYIPVGAVAIVTEKLKLGLTSEIVLWKNSYGHSCNSKYKKEINQIFTFIEDIMKRLQREIKDLDDIRWV